MNPPYPKGNSAYHTASTANEQVREVLASNEATDRCTEGCCRGVPVEGHNAPKCTGGVGPDSQGVGLLEVCPAGRPTRVGVLHNNAARFWEVTDCCVSRISIQIVVVRHLHINRRSAARTVMGEGKVEQA